MDPLLLDSELQDLLYEVHQGFGRRKRVVVGFSQSLAIGHVCGNVLGCLCCFREKERRLKPCRYMKK